MEGPGSGSPGTKTLGFQFLKGSKVTIKNGTITAKDTNEIKMLIQNYCDLTLDNVKVIGTSHTQYVVSNNYGNVTFKNGTEIIAQPGTVAFDVWYGLDSRGTYDDPGVFVNIADNSVKVEGTVEFGKQSRASWDNFESKAKLTVPTPYQLDITPSCTITGGELKWVVNGDGTKTFKYVK